MSQVVFSVALASTFIAIASPTPVSHVVDGVNPASRDGGSTTSLPQGLYTLHRRLSATICKV